MSMRLSESQAKVLLGKHYTKPKAAKPKEPKAKKAAKPCSEGELHFAMELDRLGIPYVQEYKFCPDRRWRADFKIAGRMILVEIEGGIWSGGRHTRGHGYQSDCEKYNWATANGYQVIRGTTKQVKDGSLLKTVLMMIEKEQAA